MVLQALDSQGDRGGVGMDFFAGRKIMVAGALVSDGRGGNDNLIVCLGRVQDAAGAKLDKASGSKGDDLFQARHTGGSADSGQEEAHFPVSVFYFVYRDRPVCAVQAGDFFCIVISGKIPDDAL